MDARDEPKHVVIYTDGGCSGNPGPGGYAAILSYKGHQKELSGGFACTTNNRMELKAAIAGLGALKGRCKVTLYSDSRYLVDSLTKGWVESWKAKGWQRKKQPVINADLWKELLALSKQHVVEFVWVKGHAGNRENNRCDALAVEAAKRPNLLPDEGYLGTAERKKRVAEQIPNLFST